MKPKYPNVECELSQQDGNAFVLIGYCSRQARKAGVPQQEISAFAEEAMAGDYDHLLQTCMRWFNVT